MCESHHDSNVIVRSSDTYVLIIMLTHDHVLPAQLWLEVGVSAKNSRRYIDVSKLAEDMGPELCNSIAGLHAFMGCDYTASFLHKGKVRPLSLMEKNQRFQAAFAKLGESSQMCSTTRIMQLVPS